MSDPPVPNLSSPAVIRGLLARYNVRPSRRLGQNFLADENIRRLIIREAGAGEGKRFLEIGSGLGTITTALATAGSEVVAVEKDPRLVAALGEILGGLGGVRLIAGDALELDFGELLGSTAAWRVVGNLPYAVTTPLLLKLLDADFPEMLLMVQREVAERLAAPPGDPRRGRITVRLELAGEVEILRRIPPGAFLPRPEVESVLFRFRRRPYRAGVPEEELLAVVRAAFGERRKTLRQALSRGLGRPAGEVERALREAGIAPERRGETLSLEEFAALARRLGGDELN